MKKILFVGNSYTYYNEMPEAIFVPMTKEAGLEAEVTSVTKGGYYLKQFADPENEEGKRLRETVAGKHYDWIVLQDQSCYGVVDPRGFLDGVGAIKEVLAQNTDRFLLYATWGRKEGCDKLEELGLTRQEMTNRLEEAYSLAGAKYGMEVAHVGTAFLAYQAENPEAELYHPDKSHPSALGSRIAAETILKAIL